MIERSLWECADGWIDGMCLCVWRGGGNAGGGYICHIIGTTYHGRVTWILSLRLSVCNPDILELAH